MCNGSKESVKELAVCALHLVGDWCAINVQQQRNLELVMTAGIVPYALQWQRPRVSDGGNAMWIRIFMEIQGLQDGAYVSEMHKDLL
jgi:hypothetical protein